MFQNQKKKTENSPDYTGNCMILGVVYSIACWNNTSKTGNPYITMRIREESDEYTDKSNTTSSSSDPF
jgi:uncharacterized protein (DUF736 family)